MEAINEPVAVLYQAEAASAVGGSIKPMKPGGYRDSSADIAFALQQAGVAVMTPQVRSDPHQDGDWCFPDTVQSIEELIAHGARTLWTNTVLSASHPLTRFKNQGLWIVGQHPETVQERDDKWSTNHLLQAAGCPIPRMTKLAAYTSDDGVDLRALSEAALATIGLVCPLVIKPIRGRGSEGVTKVETIEYLRDIADPLLTQGRYGNALMLEEFLPGEEITVSVMPPGHYVFGSEERALPHHWALPAVRRFNHRDGIAPYNGVIAVTHNSRLVPAEEQAQPHYTAVLSECERAAALVGALAPIRIDCRAASDGSFRLFDLNMKPNMTGAGRPGREEQDSLTCIAARAVGWTYTDLLLNMLRQAWPF